MARNKPTRQHYVPQCYLREWADLRGPTSAEPFVWIFEKNGKNKRRDKVKNVLVSSDLYTLRIKGQKNYSVEETFATLEGRYAQVFRDKISQKLSLSEEEHIVLCAFVSAMMQRTLRHKDNFEAFYDQLIEHSEAMERAYHLPPNKSQELREFRKNIHTMGTVGSMPDIAELLFHMRIAFLCAGRGSKFITSDDPCHLFNAKLQWQRFYGPGLAQKDIEVLLPLSPEILMCMSWGNLRGYLRWDKRRVEDANRMIRGHTYRYFIADSPKTKRIWFSRYPMDAPFILRVLIHKFRSWIYDWTMRHHYRNVRKK
jgi:hypothetical protein